MRTIIPIHMYLYFFIFRVVRFLMIAAAPIGLTSRAKIGALAALYPAFDTACEVLESVFEN